MKTSTDRSALVATSYIVDSRISIHYQGNQGKQEECRLTDSAAGFSMCMRSMLIAPCGQPQGAILYI